MKEQVLSVEQMQELKELGIDITSASMKWAPKLRWDKKGNIREVYGYILDINYTPVGAPFWNTMDGKDTIPTFTLHDILEMLPKVIMTEEDNFELYLNTYQCYAQYRDPKHNKMLNVEFSDTNSILDACFNMLKWCKQNNYI